MATTRQNTVPRNVTVAGGTLLISVSRILSGIGGKITEKKIKTRTILKFL